jgi:hypothetical protein
MCVAIFFATRECISYELKNSSRVISTGAPPPTTLGMTAINVLYD